MIENKNIVIIGAGKTGKALCRVLSSFSVNIVLMDKKKEDEIKEEIAELKNKKILFHFGGYDEKILFSSDMIILSPGVSPQEEIIKAAREKGIKITGEVEIAYNIFPNKNIIAITGTDGKTTTTTLTYEIFKKAMPSVHIAGNIGFPIIEVLQNAHPDDYIISELSSFQLETTETFKPKISVIINIAQDHLDRHKTMDNYINCKSKIFLNQTKDDFVILNYDNEITRELSKFAKANVIFFSQKEKIKNGIFVDGGKVISTIFGKYQEIISVDDIKIKGRHNIENSLCAISCALLCGIEIEQIQNVLRTFEGVPHRQEFVDEIEGIKFINDSKATTPNATLSALLRFESPIILIAGGKTKESDFSHLAKEISRKVKKLILIGEGKQSIAKAVENVNYHDFVFAENLEEATNIAYSFAESGDVVLLSPACSSLDQFKNYEERGEVFKKIVRKLKHG